MVIFMMWIWLCLIIVLSLLEFASKNFIPIWFVFSAVISFILSIFIDAYIIQFLVFVILGSVLLLTTRDYLIRFVNDKKIKRGKSEK